MKIPTNKQFAEHVKKSLIKSGIKPATFGRDVLNDSGAIHRLFKGTNPRLSTVIKIAKAIKLDFIKHSELISKVRKYLNLSGESKASLGRRIAKDASFVHRLYHGLDPKLSTVKKIIDALKDKK